MNLQVSEPVIVIIHETRTCTAINNLTGLTNSPLLCHERLLRSIIRPYVTSAIGQSLDTSILKSELTGW